MSAPLIGRLGSSAFRPSTTTVFNVARGLVLLFSNRPSGVKRFQTIHHHSVQCRSRARASLRNRHQGPSIMGFEDGVEQSLPRPCHQTSDGSKRTYELTSSIVPQGTYFHGLVEFEFL